MATFEEILDAFYFVSSAEYGMNHAILCLDDGRIYFRSDDGDLDDLDEDEFDCNRFLAIPHKNDIDLGARLVLEFVDLQIPDDLEMIDRMFRSRGAYRRFRDFLSCRGLLQSWHDFEKRRTQETLLKWCRDHEIEL